jgi:hypothetical protein
MDISWEYHDVTDGKPRKNWGLENDRTGVGIYQTLVISGYDLRTGGHGSLSWMI